MLKDLLWEIRRAARTLRRSPRFALVVILTFGLGVGAATAIFSVVDTILLRPLPFRDAERLVAIVQHMPPHRPGGQPSSRGFTRQQFEQWRTGTRTLSAHGGDDDVDRLRAHQPGDGTALGRHGLGPHVPAPRLPGPARSHARRVRRRRPERGGAVVRRLAPAVSVRPRHHRQARRISRHRRPRPGHDHRRHHAGRFRVSRRAHGVLRAVRSECHVVAGRGAPLAARHPAARRQRGGGTGGRRGHRAGDHRTAAGRRAADGRAGTIRDPERQGPRRAGTAPGAPCVLRGRGRLAAHRLRQRRQSVAGAQRRPSPRDGRAGGDGCEPLANRARTAGGRAGAGRPGRPGRRGARRAGRGARARTWRRSRRPASSA